MLKSCVEEHPLLSHVIVNGDTEAPIFATARTLDLYAHLEIREPPHARDDECIETLLAQLSDEQFHSVHTTPPWKVILVALTTEDDTQGSRLLVLYTNYHSHGDGRSGLAFQNSFHAGLARYFPKDDFGQKPKYNGSVCKPSTFTLLPPIEEGGKLTLSWSYLLSPLLGAHLPPSIASFFGLRTSWISSDIEIWRGEKAWFDPGNHTTGLVLVTIDPDTMSKVLQLCRARKTTFTGLLQHLITRSLIAPDGGAVTANAFNAGVAVDMRHLFPGRYSSTSIMNCVTGHSEMVQCNRSQTQSDWATNPSSQFWEAARKTTASLTAASSTLHNQPIGLLQYLKGFRAWTNGQIGKEREMSFEISNLGAFSPALALDGTDTGVAIERVVFSQPAKASGSLLDFNPVSLKGGALDMTVTWQRGVLGLPEDVDETAFVKKVCQKLEALIFEVAAVSS